MSHLLCNQCNGTETTSDSYVVNCFYCGEYEIVGTLASTSKSEEDKKKCSVMVKRYWESNNEKFLLNSNSYKNLIEQYNSFNLQDRIRNVLNYIGKNSKPGEYVVLGDDMKFVAPTTEVREFQLISTHLVDENILKIKMGSRYALTVYGWEKFNEDEEIINPKLCFIAMSLSSDEIKDDYNKYIKPVLEKLGFQGLVMDEVEHNEDIVFEIFYHIKRSRFVIADVREQKPNVYYEAGYSRGLGREVIWICNKEDVDKMQFDTRNLNHIIWDTKEDLMEKLEKRIKGTILS